MEHSKTTQLTPESLAILRLYGETERLCREKERRHITTLSRTQAWELERKGQFPTRKKIGRTNAWLLSDLLLWVYQQGPHHND